jgi:hypothetical protein
MPKVRIKPAHQPSKELFELTSGHGNSFPFFVAETNTATSYFARGFHDAARDLIEKLKKTDFPDYQVLPVTFLYRHALETALKGLIWDGDDIARQTGTRTPSGDLGPTKSNHDLAKLLPFAEHVMKAFAFKWDESKISWDEAKEVIQEFNDIDPGSFAFRYPMTKKGDPSGDQRFGFNVLRMAMRLDPILDQLSAFSYNLEDIRWNELTKEMPE